MTNKHGFWTVIVHRDDGRKAMCKDWIDGDYTSQFDSEEYAEAFKQGMSSRYPESYYYIKFIPWGEYA